MQINGQFTIDYSNNDGVRIIGEGNATFETKWSRAGNGSIHAYDDPPSIEAIAIATNARNFSDIKDASRFDYSSRTRTVKTGEILLIRNKSGIYAGLEILDVKSAGHDNPRDELTAKFVILTDGGKNFSNLSDMKVTDESFSKRTLLLGAGFSRNWGGLLANEVGIHVLGHTSVQTRPKLQELLRKGIGFEDALEETRTGLYEQEDAQAMESAIQSAFDQMDTQYKNPTPPVLPATINDFLSRFCTGAVGQGTGYIFSLNQDLLLERIYGTKPDKQHFSYPGIKWAAPPSLSPMAANQIPIATVIDPITGQEPQLLKNFNLIKLHGSINWRDGNNSSAMVMGRRKRETISSSPLLEWYYRVFEAVLSQGSVKLMVIGYGWADDHINQVIANSVQKHGLKIYTWAPSAPVDALKGKHKGDVLLSGVIGAQTRSMPEVMPNNPTNPGSAAYDSLIKQFFS